jgi:hypothetical protein
LPLLAKLKVESDAELTALRHELEAAREELHRSRQLARD